MSMSTPTSPSSSSSPSLSSNKLTASLNAARRGESSSPSTPPSSRRPQLSATARKQALRDFYNLDKSKTTIHTTIELDKPDFDGRDYVDRVVREKGLGTLLRMENEIVQEIRNLDGERKSLVYDNYNKLITATETIQKMRKHLDPLDPNQSNLGPSIQRISELSMSLNPSDDIDASSSSLAEQVRWAIQSPERIRQLVRSGHRAKAEEHLELLKSVLQKWDNVKDSQELLNACKAALAFGE